VLCYCSQRQAFLSLPERNTDRLRCRGNSPRHPAAGSLSGRDLQGRPSPPCFSSLPPLLGPPPCPSFLPLLLAPPSCPSLPLLAPPLLPSCHLACPPPACLVGQLRKRQGQVQGLAPLSVEPGARDTHYSTEHYSGLLHWLIEALGTILATILASAVGDRGTGYYCNRPLSTGCLTHTAHGWDGTPGVIHLNCSCKAVPFSSPQGPAVPFSQSQALHWSGATQGQYSDSLVIAQGQHRDSTVTVQDSTGTAQNSTGTAQGQYGDSTGTVQGQHRNSTGAVQGQYRDSTGTVQGQYSDSTGTVQGQHRNSTGAVTRVKGGNCGVRKCEAGVKPTLCNTYSPHLLSCITTDRKG